MARLLQRQGDRPLHGRTARDQVDSASRQEYDIYPELYEDLVENLGCDPQAVVADKGFSVESVFEHNTRKGVASIIHWRKRNGADRRHDEERWDRHGIPRCPACGGESRFVRFNENPYPCLWFDCIRRPTPECKKTRRIACSNNWRFLLPLWRTDVRYHELAASHDRFEAVHDYWRDRYCVAGDGVQTRPKRIGRGCQYLRAQAALLVEWLRICAREGWLGSARRNANQPRRDDACPPNKNPNSWTSKGRRALDDLRDFRRKIGLHLHYGAAADKLGLGKLLPPSRRSASKGSGSGGGAGGSPPPTASP